GCPLIAHLPDHHAGLWWWAPVAAACRPSASDSPRSRGRLCEARLRASACTRRNTDRPAPADIPTAAVPVGPDRSSLKERHRSSRPPLREAATMEGLATGESCAYFPVAPVPSARRCCLQRSA